MIIFLDANAVIYLIEAVDPFQISVQRILQKLNQQYPEAHLAISRLSYLECMVKPVRDNDVESLTLYHRFFNAPTLRAIDLTATVIAEATLIRAFSNLKTADALQAASALTLFDDTIFVTGDRSFTKVPGLQVEIIQ